MDRKRDDFIINEFKRLGDKIVAETTNLDRRVSVLEKQDHSKQLLDSKLDRKEFTNFVSRFTDETLNPMQNEIEKCKKDI